MDKTYKCIVPFINKDLNKEFAKSINITFAPNNVNKRLVIPIKQSRSYLAYKLLFALYNLPISSFYV